MCTPVDGRTGGRAGAQTCGGLGAPAVRRAGGAARGRWDARAVGRAGGVAHGSKEAWEVLFECCVPAGATGTWPNEHMFARAPVCTDGRASTRLAGAPWL